MSLDFNVRVYPVEDANGSKPLEEKTNHPQFASKQPIAKAEIALHRSGCSGFCGLSGREPEDYATVFVTSKAEISRALQVCSHTRTGPTSIAHTPQKSCFRNDVYIKHQYCKHLSS